MNDLEPDIHRQAQLPEAVALHQGAPTGNPYDHSRPVTAPQLFAGRDAVVKQLRYVLSLATSAQPQVKNVAITGDRGIGKTSLLNRFAAMAEEDYGLLAARVDLNTELAANQSALFRAIVEESVTKLRTRQQLGQAKHLLERLFGGTKFDLELDIFVAKLKAAQKDTVSEALPQEQLALGLQRLARQAAKLDIPALVICIDEAHLLAQKNNETILQALRNTFQAQQHYMLVISGTENLLDELGSVFGPIQRFFEQVRLGPFATAEEVLQCLRSPLPEADRERVDLGLAAEMLQQTGGKPFLIKLLAYHAFKAADENRWTTLRITQDVFDSWSNAAQHHGYKDLADAAAGRLRESGALDVDEAAEVDASATEDRAIVLDEPQREGGETANPDDEGHPVIYQINALLRHALQRRASEVLLQAGAESMRVRYRIDGVLHDTEPIAGRDAKRALARLKIIFRLDIAERRIPQDGVATLRLDGREWLARIVTLPTPRGESAFIGMQSPQEAALDLGQIGLHQDDLGVVTAKLRRSQGLIVVAGAAKSGVTTALDAAVKNLLERPIHVVTIGPTHGRSFETATQMVVNERIGLSHASALRIADRSGADAIVVNELPDHDTADNSVKAASRRLLLVGVRVESAGEAVLRMMQFGVDRFALADGLTLVLAPRLARRLCDICRIAPRPGSPDAVWRVGAGCPACERTGYRGFVGLVSVLQPDEPLRQAMRDNAEPGVLLVHAARCVAHDFESLVAAAVQRGEIPVPAVASEP